MSVRQIIDQLRRAMPLNGLIQELDKAYSLEKRGVVSTPDVVSTKEPSVVSTCPACEARKKAKTLAQKKWRKDKSTGQPPP